MWYSHNPTIQIYRCREIRNTDDSLLFRYETFINFLTLVFRHEERETQFLLCWLYYLTQQTHRASRSPQDLCRQRSAELHSQTSTSTVRLNGRQTNCLLHRPLSIPSWSGPAHSRISTNVFFKITKFSAHRFRAWRHSHPSFISYLGFLLWHLWLSYPLRASVNCTQCVCTCTKSRNSSKPNQTQWWNIINEKWLI